ncbi:MAG: phospholipase [Chlorobi bacterium]|nr:phospholipase [Chlorobiota bacterium]
MVYLFAGIIVVLVIAYFVSRDNGKAKDNTRTRTEVQADCCGAHDVCETETLLNSKPEIVYFEDEELDRFAGASKNSINDDDIEEFREVLYSLKDEEVSEWLKSLQLRKITIPDIIKEEALMIVSERRFQNEVV